LLEVISFEVLGEVTSGRFAKLVSLEVLGEVRSGRFDGSSES